MTGVLGEGGMGVVYDARDPDLDRAVAVKLIHEQDPQHAIRLLREAQALARLQHPNVVGVHEVGRHGDQVFVAMERVDGVSLDRLDPKPADWREVLRLFIQAGRGLAAAHDKGLVHRDVKPHNLLVDRDGRVRVADFGLVRLADGPPPTAEADENDPHPSASPTATTVEDTGELPAPAAVTPGTGALGSALTRANAYMGTPRYMAPEQHERRQATAASDQFSFCVALWETLFGEHPFERDPAVAWATAVTGNRRRPAPRGKAPAWLIAALDRGLAMDPARRHPTMRALVEQLERGLVPRRRWPWVAAALALSGAAVGVVVLARGRGNDMTAVTTDTPPTPQAAPPAPPLRVLATRRLTVDAGCEEFPSFTPDGRTVLYDGAVAGGYSIFAIDVDSGKSSRLTDFAGWDYAPAVSPDGSQFAFVRNDNDLGAAVYVAPLPAGKPVRRLALGGARPNWSTDPNFLWAGDLTRPTRMDVRTGAEHSHVVAPPGAVSSIGVEGAHGELLITLFAESGQGLGIAILRPDGEPRWVEQAWYHEAMTPLPGRRSVLASRETPGGKPVVVRIGMDGTFEPLPLGEIQARTGISMSPDGRRLVWSNCSVENDLAFIEPAVGGAPRLAKVLAGDWKDSDPSSIPGTSQIIVASDRRGDTELWVIDVTGKLPARVLPSGNVVKAGSAVSLDHRWVVYVGGEDDGRGLFVVPFDGNGKRRQLTTDESDQTPGIAADGFVYFGRNPGGGPRWDVMRVPLAGGTAEIAVADADTPAVSPDGQALLFMRGNRAYLRDLRTGADRRLTPKPLSYTRNAFSADGKLIGLLSNERLVVIDRATAKQSTAFTSGSAMLLGVAFVGDRPLLAVQRFEGDLWLADTEVTAPPP